MKKLTILLFSILISFNSYSEWTEIEQSTEGVTYYIDKDTIKERGGNVYFWGLLDRSTPDSDCSGLTNLDTKIALYPSRGY